MSYYAFTCGTCGNEFDSDQVYWTINLHQESMKGFCTTVHAAQGYSTYCSPECTRAAGYKIPDWMLDPASEETTTGRDADEGLVPFDEWIDKLKAIGVPEAELVRLLRGEVESVL